MAILQCASFSFNNSFHENIILVARIDPTNGNINDIRNKLRGLMEDSIQSLDIMRSNKNDVNDRMECETHNNVSPNFTGSKKGSELFSDIVRMFI